MSTLEVAVLMGGPSPEHEVSLASAQVVCDGLSRDEFLVRPFLLGRDLSWTCTAKGVAPGFDLKTLAELPAVERSQALTALAACDVAFVAIHGAYGEDGRIQGLLECLSLPYTGSGVEGSVLAINKILTKELLSIAAVPHAKHRVVHRQRWRSAPQEIRDELRGTLGTELVVKSPTLGSSFGVHLIRAGAGLAGALDDVLATEDVALVEVLLPGREVSCGVLEDEGGTPSALPPTEIITPAGRDFDYDAKYTPGVTQEVTPPQMPPEWLAEIQTRALQVHQILGLRGMSRTDMMVSENGHATILEVNTIPGLTRTSLLPQAAAVAGLELPEMLAGLLRVALAQAHERNEAEP